MSIKQTVELYLQMQNKDFGKKGNEKVANGKLRNGGNLKNPEKLFNFSYF